ncbi:hypothetical protein [Paenibacillus koleovorans]|uniref:hypothetical protein n=1 Tax=Paenibacillus koleovorans TaxID=121608 RepID=UPI000FD96279|nr:hypothetical protein [Paenibacillus koleovorans]
MLEMQNKYTVEQVGGNWCFVGPDGKPFYSVGVNAVHNQVLDQTHWLKTDWVEKFGGGRDWFARWAGEKLGQVRQYGFNTLGAWHEPYYWGNGTPKTVEIRMSRHAPKVNTDWGTGFPDVFDKKFRASVERACIDCFQSGRGEALLHDPGVIGYYTDNEIHWWGHGGQWGNNDPGNGVSDTSLVDDYLELAAGRPGKMAWIELLQERHGGSIERLNEAWGAEYTAWEDLAYIAVYRADHREVLEADKTAFLRRIAEVYYKTTSEALKRYDPGRLNLGDRMVGTSTPEVVLDVMKDYADVITLNFYSFNLPVRWLEYTHSRTGLPIMITEFSFCAGAEAGFLINTNGARNVIVRSQARRGETYREFVSAAAELPFIVGTHWFALYDYGNPQGLIGNYGLLDLADEPYAEFCESVRQTNEAVLRRRRG